MKRILLISSLFFSLSFYGQNDTNDFVFTINGIEGGKVVKMQKKQLKNAVIGFKSKNKNLGLSKRVTSFGIKIPGVQLEKVIGDKIDERTYQRILKYASIGDILVFSDIKMNENKIRKEGPMCFLSPPIVIEIY